MPDILEFIKTIRESFGASVAVYTHGNCYQFYEILKCVYPEAVAYYDGNHVFTKIGDNFYDIRGKLDVVCTDGNYSYKKKIGIHVVCINLNVVTNDMISGLSINKRLDNPQR